MVPHLRIPFQLDARGQAAVVEQNSLVDVGQCVRSLLLTYVGHRVELYDYGVPDLAFSDARKVPGEVGAAIAAWEPRAIGAHVDAVPADDGSASITVLLPGGST